MQNIKFFVKVYLFIHQLPEATEAEEGKYNRDGVHPIFKNEIINLIKGDLTHITGCRDHFVSNNISDLINKSQKDDYIDLCNNHYRKKFSKSV